MEMRIEGVLGFKVKGYVEWRWKREVVNCEEVVVY